MQKENSIYELKAQARRLRTALAEMPVQVSHSQALNLIARAQGHRNWESLEALMQSSTMQEMNVQEQRDVFLRWLSESIYQTLEDLDALDECVYQVAGDQSASSINNQGVYAQLDVLLRSEEERSTSFEQSKRALISWLREELVLPDTMYTLPVCISVCAGSLFAQERTVDGLAWFACQDYEGLLRLVKAGLANNEVTDEIGLWLADNSPHVDDRKELSDMLAYMRNVCSSHPEVVGITVSVDLSAFDTFIQGTNSLTTEQVDTLDAGLPV